MTTSQADRSIDDDRFRRCWWCRGHSDYQHYHDHEWGHPVADDRRLFEKICLEGFQSGLSWLTILRKRESFREAFADFDFQRVANFRTRQIEQLLKNEGIVRHRGKIEATVNNAIQAVKMCDEFGSLAAWFWQYEPNPQGRAPFTTQADAKAHTTCNEASSMSRALKKRGWKFVGPTTAYAFMQAMGMTNDHLTGCDWFATVEQLRKTFRRPTL